METKVKLYPVYCPMCNKDVEMEVVPKNVSRRFALNSDESPQFAAVEYKGWYWMGRCKECGHHLNVPQKELDATYGPGEVQVGLLERKY